MNNIQSIRDRLCSLGDREKAQVLQRFFKTGPGEYAEGDVFVGIKVPEIRKLAREYRDLPLSETARLLQSSIHEARLLALFILVSSYAKGTEELREEIYQLYRENTRFINNWDLVDCSAEHIVGAYLKDRDKAPLTQLAMSAILWERRIAVMATFHYIKQGEFAETLRIAALLLHDREELIHKAVGWMLREVGKREQETEEAFLRAHYRVMPRTMLRYAIERFPEELRQGYLKGKI